MIYSLSLHDALPILLSLGIVEGSSVMGLTEAEYAALSPEEQADRRWKVEEKFLAAGASAVLRNLSELPAYLEGLDRKSTRLNSSHVSISYAVFCLKK